MNKKERFRVDSPVEIEKPDMIKYWYEPVCIANIISPIEHIKSVKSLCHDRRG